MLNIYLGVNEGEKLIECAKKMKELTEQKRQVTAVVPDQFSFAFDKALYKELGAKTFNRITTISFRRFSENLIERFGTPTGTLVSQNDRMILLYLALKRTRAAKTLKILDRSAEKTSFCEDMSQLIDSFRRSGVTAEALKAASESSGGTLGDKLSDVSDIYSQYISLMEERGCRDESSVITEGARIAAANSVFKGSSVFVFRFDSFSPDELKLLEAALRDADSVTVCLDLPEKYRRSAVSPFMHCENTQNELVKLAAAVNSPLRYTVNRAPKTRDSLLEAVGECLYAPAGRVDGPAGGSLNIIRADSIHEESEYVAAAVRRLSVVEGKSLNSIAVLTHDLESYADALSASFERYGVEAFIDRPQSAAGMSLALYVLDAVDAASTRQPDTDRILKYLRSPFSPLSQEEVSELWDYCVYWNVDGKMWNEDFTAGDEKTDLDKINEMRKKAEEPLERLREASKGASAKDIASAFCEFLKETGAAGRAYSVIDGCTDEELKLSTARLFKQLWNAVMSAISSVWLIAGEEKLTLKTFGELLRLILSQTKISNPPQKLESVTVADVSRSIIAEPETVFVVGLADGFFPADVKKNGLFSGRDIAALEELGVRFDVTPEARLCSERYDCYRALTSASKCLNLSWSGKDLKGKELRPSRFIKRITDMCGAKITPARSLGAEFYCSTPRSAYYNCSVSTGLSPKEKASVREALNEIPEYREKLELSAAEGGYHKLDPDISRRLFAPGDINITASRIDVYNRCNFEYFCKFGLKIKPVTPLSIDPSNRGSVMHYLFESVLGYYGDRFSEAEDGEIELLIAKLLDEYSKENFGGDFGKTAKFMADYNRLGGAAMEILLNMREEFKVSKFRPVRFEYSLSDENGESVLKIPLGRGVSIKIRGIVDRVDTYVSPSGKRYIRVVDYKTGEKKFCFEDIYNGLNLQILLYMLALTEGSDKSFNDCIPGGVLYMRAGFLKCSDDFDPLSSESGSRLVKSAEQLKRSGLLTENEESLEAMDSGFSGRFAPVKKNKDGTYSKLSQTVSEAGFKRLEDFARQKAVQFGRDLLAGKIDAVPAGSDPDHLRCAYCDYVSVCDRRKYRMKIINKSDGEILKAEICGGEAE